MNYKLERIWNEAAMAEFKVLSRNLPGGTEENHGKPQDSSPPGRDFNLGFSEKEPGVLTARLGRSVSRAHWLIFEVTFSKVSSHKGKARLCLNNYVGCVGKTPLDGDDWSVSHSVFLRPGKVLGIHLIKRLE
jgi:hypothetical protein